MTGFKPKADPESKTTPTPASSAEKSESAENTSIQSVEELTPEEEAEIRAEFLLAVEEMQETNRRKMENRRLDLEDKDQLLSIWAMAVLGLGMLLIYLLFNDL